MMRTETICIHSPSLSNLQSNAKPRLSVPSHEQIHLCPAEKIKRFGLALKSTFGFMYPISNDDSGVTGYLLALQRHFE